MKKYLGNFLVVAFFIFAITDIIREFISSDGVHYYSDQPQRLLFVPIFGIIVGLVAFGFSALSRRWQRRVKLAVLGLGGSFVLLAGSYLSFQVANLPARMDPTIPRQIPWLLVLGTVAIAGLLWFEFFQILRKHDHVA